MVNHEENDDPYKISLLREEHQPKNGELCIRYFQCLDEEYAFGRVVEDSNSKNTLGVGTNVYYKRSGIKSSKNFNYSSYDYVHISDVNVDFDIMKSFELRKEMKDYDSWHKTLNYSMIFNVILLISVCYLIGEVYV